MAGFLTNSGLAKLAVATPLAPMTVKYMAFDAGQGTPSATMTVLFNEVYRTEIPNPVKDPDNPKNLTFTGFVPTTVGGWTIYGIGLFDSLGVLVAYLQLAEPVLKSDPSSALKMSWEQDFIITLANAGETDLIITDSIKFRHDAITHRDLPDSHPMSAIAGLVPALDGIASDRDSTRATKVITANYTVLNTDSGILEVNAASGNIVITMAKSTSHIAKELLIIRTDASANTVTVNPASGDTFNGDGFSYSVGTMIRYEPTLFKAGVNYWTGVRSAATQLSNRTGLQIIDKGVPIGQPVLMTDVDDFFVGMVAPFAMNAAPNGWLACSGQNVSRTTYAKLFAKIGTTFGTGDGTTTFTLPDMRGEFVRGFDAGRGIDAGRGFGSWQADSFKEHNHTIQMGGDQNSTVNADPLNAVTTSAAPVNSGVAGDAQIKNNGSTETRPRNIALLYCIKF